HPAHIYYHLLIARQIIHMHCLTRLPIKMPPLCHYGSERPHLAFGSNHARSATPQFSLRLTCDLPVSQIEHDLPFVLDRPMHFVLGPDEEFKFNVTDFVRDALARTRSYWWEWVRYLSIPFEWQEAVIRAWITLKLCRSETPGG